MCVKAFLLLTEWNQTDSEEGGQRSAWSILEEEGRPTWLSANQIPGCRGGEKKRFFDGKEQEEEEEADRFITCLFHQMLFLDTHTQTHTLRD